MWFKNCQYKTFFPVNFLGNLLSSVDEIRNLDFWFDSNFFFSCHVRNICWVLTGCLSCIALSLRQPHWCTSQSEGLLLEVPHFSSIYKSKKQFSLSFAYDAPKNWNDPPDDVHSPKSLSSFRNKLKIYLFAKPYPP